MRKALVWLAHVGLGIVFGYGTLETGILGVLFALIALALLLRQVRRHPERPGGFLLGLGLAAVTLLLLLVARMPACPRLSVHGECYAASTLPALLISLLAALAGLALTAGSVIAARVSPRG